MLVNITDIKHIISESKKKAVRAVDHECTLMYRHIGNVFSKKNRKVKSVPIMVFRSLICHIIRNNTDRAI
jgi:hypothetical protein